MDKTIMIIWGFLLGSSFIMFWSLISAIQRDLLGGYLGGQINRVKGVHAVILSLFPLITAGYVSFFTINRIFEISVNIPKDLLLISFALTISFLFAIFYQRYLKKIYHRQSH